MEVFAATVAEGSFSAAGRCLGLTPSAVSRTIDRIEARLGVRLLLRSTRALALTPEGEAYLRAARRILADLGDAEQAIADRSSETSPKGPELLDMFRFGEQIAITAPKLIARSEQRSMTQ